MQGAAPGGETITIVDPASLASVTAADIFDITWPSNSLDATSIVRPIALFRSPDSCFSEPVLLSGEVAVTVGHASVRVPGYTSAGQMALGIAVTSGTGAGAWTANIVSVMASPSAANMQFCSPSNSANNVSVTVTSPGDHALVAAGSAFNVTWTVSGVDDTTLVRVMPLPRLSRLRHLVAAAPSLRVAHAGIPLHFEPCCCLTSRCCHASSCAGASACPGAIQQQRLLPAAG